MFREFHRGALRDASSHTPEAVSRGGRVVALNIVVGDVIFFDDSGRNEGAPTC